MVMGFLRCSGRFFRRLSVRGGIAGGTAVNDMRDRIQRLAGLNELSDDRETDWCWQGRSPAIASVALMPSQWRAAQGASVRNIENKFRK
jgi:hypothetical protein